MPTYEYSCDYCEHFLEVYQKLSDKPLKKCPQCKKHKLVKLISLPGKPVIPGHPFEEHAKIKKEAKEIAQKILKGDEKTIADIYGDGAVQSTNLKKSKKMNEIKPTPKGTGNFRRR